MAAIFKLKMAEIYAITKMGLTQLLVCLDWMEVIFRPLYMAAILKIKMAAIYAIEKNGSNYAIETNLIPCSCKIKGF